MFRLNCLKLCISSGIILYSWKHLKKKKKKLQYRKNVFPNPFNIQISHYVYRSQLTENAFEPLI